MKKNYKAITIAAALLLCLSTNNFAFAKQGFNVAVVDTKQVIQNSPQIKAFNIEQNNKLNDLNVFIAKAKADIAKQTDATKRKALEESYNQELASKKVQLDKDASKKLSDIYNDLNIIVKNEAKKAGYDLILVKEGVLYGGTDITADIIKTLK